MKIASEKSDMSRYIKRIKDNKKTIVKITLSITIIVLLIFLIYPKSYESSSVIQIGEIKGATTGTITGTTTGTTTGVKYSTVESKAIIESSEILNPIIKEYHPKLDIKNFIENHLKTEVIKETIGFQVETSQYIRLTTIENDPETAREINSKIIENFLSKVIPEYNLNLEVLTNELSEIKENIDSIKADISDLEKSMESTSIGNTENLITLKAILSNQREILTEESARKFELERILSSKKEFKIISFPETPKSPSFPGAIQVLIITLIISFAISLLYVSIKKPLER